MKSLLTKTTFNGDLGVDAAELRKGLLEWAWRNRPSSNGFSPVQRLCCKPIRSFVLAHRNSFAAWQLQALADLIDERAVQTRQRCQDHYNVTTRSLPRLCIGTSVDVQDPRTKLWSKLRIIVAVGGHRDYIEAAEWTCLLAQSSLSSSVSYPSCRGSFFISDACGQFSITSSMQPLSPTT